MNSETFTNHKAKWKWIFENTQTKCKVVPESLESKMCYNYDNLTYLTYRELRKGMLKMQNQIIFFLRATCEAVKILTDLGNEKSKCFMFYAKTWKGSSVFGFMCFM